MSLVMAAISWTPEIRNILGVLVGTVLLCGSVYLLLFTNTGARLGLLISLACLFGWMTTMGVIWWIYGIGMKGEESHWQVRDIVAGETTQSAVDEVHALPMPDDLPDPDTIVESDPELAEQFGPVDDQPARQPTLGDLIEVQPSLVDELDLDSRLGGWTLLQTSDPQRGDAAAAADAALGPDGQGIFEQSSDYKVVDVFSRGGKDRLDEDASTLERIEHKIVWSLWHWSHPTHFAVVQVQGVEEVEVEPGETPPPPTFDEDAPVYSVVLIRDLGDKRFPAAMVTIVFGVLFALTCNALHRRDKLIAQNRTGTA